VLVFVVLVVGGVVAVSVLGGSKSDDDDSGDDTPVHVHKRALTPPPPVVADAGVAAPAAAPVDALVIPQQPDAAPIAQPTEGSGEATAESLYTQGQHLAAKNDLPHALTALTKARDLDPDFAPTYRALGALYLKMNDHAKARAAYQKYLQLAPSAADGTQIRALLEKL
jgi:thioredoxin-like negative regulator of GroEL